MVRDRSAEFQAKSEAASQDEAMIKKGKVTKMDHTLPDFLNKISQIEGKISGLKDSVDKMRKIQRDLYASPSIDNKQVKTLDALSDQVLTAAVQINRDIKNLRTEVGIDSSSTNGRLMLTHLDRLSLEITRLMNYFGEVQVEHIDRTKKIHKKQVEIMHKEDESGGTAELQDIQTMFTGNFLQEQQQSLLDLQEIEVRNEEIKKLETGVVEVNNLFKAINAMILLQGETIDTIEKHVTEATCNVEEGNVQLVQAKKNKKKWFRKKLFLAGCIVLVILVIAGVITVVIVTQR